MNALTRAILAIAIGSVAAPGWSQGGAYDGEQLVSAIRKGDGGAALALLKEKPSLVDARDLNGKTALIMAIETRNDDWTGYLLQQGASPNLAMRDGETPLMVASRLGSQNAVDWLIASGARVDDSNRKGETALIVAVQRRQLPVVRALLKAGADPDKTDSAAGYSAREYAKRDNRTPELLRAIEANKPKP
ncbi:MAG TPA: ankyrin repeat domain-containing protein [Sphingomicrobium sp.]|nr:ankyrin repeat domain-containing protein [Sphingomicrobium sp.]